MPRKRAYTDDDYRVPSLRIGVRDAKANLSRVIREVKAGKEVLITEYGRPVARVVPITQTSLEDRIAEMELQGEIARGKRTSTVPPTLNVPEGVAQKYLQEGRG